MTKIISVLFLSFFICGIALSQVQTSTNAAKIDNSMISGKFDRKSITIIPLTLNTVNKYYTEMIEGVNSIPPSGRFDNNYILSDYLQKAQKSFLNAKLTAFNYENDQDVLLKALKTSGALKEIIKSASNIDSLMARIQRSKKRIVISALEEKKIRMPGVKDIMTLINNTYIGIPVLKSMEIKDNNYTANGDLLWLKIDISNVSDWDETVPNMEQVKLKLVTQREAKISPENLDFLSESLMAFNEKEKDLPKDKKAARNFAKALINMAMGMEEFKVRATIQDVEEGIRIDIGNREGVYLDQGYKVFEQRLDETGTVYSEYLGFIRVDNVADNSVKFDALSGCYQIIPGGFEAGHIITSHDQSFDILIRPQYKKVLIPKEFGQGLLSSNASSGIFKDDVTDVLTAEFAVVYNAARLFNSTQFFIGISGFIGLPNSTKNDANIYSNLTINTPLVYGGHIVLQKKFWLYRTAFSIELQGGAQTLALAGKFKDVFNKEVDWEYNTGWNISIGGTVGFEFAISPDVNLGVEAGYSYVMSPTEVKFKFGNNPETTFKKGETGLIGTDFWKLNRLDDLQLGGLKLGLKLSFSMPPLF